MRQLITTVVISLMAGQARLLYEHGYHAGNYADVVKHSVLIQLLNHMQKKNSPFVYVETHAGAGCYPLDSMESQMLAEHEDGIGLLLRDPSDAAPIHMHPATDQLLDLMDQLSSREKNPDYPLYPGSPLIASSICRSQDTLILCEKETEQFLLLQQQLGNDDRVSLIQDNGYKAMKRFDNIKSQQRALIFVDPPYQMGSDSEQIASLVKFCQTHWKSGRLAIWHPVSESNRAKADRLYDLVMRALENTNSECLAAELYDDYIGRVGTGMLLVNPPYGIEEDLSDLLSALGNGLTRKGGRPQMQLKKL
eukprot:scaffold4531_cov103-Cylindrotheca_fusiformis.AAC.3